MAGENKKLYEAPGEFSAAAKRFGKRLKDAAGAAIGNRKSKGALKVQDVAAKLANDWVEFSGEQDFPDTFENLMQFLKTQKGYEPPRETYNQLANYMKTGKIVSVSRENTPATVTKKPSAAPSTGPAPVTKPTSAAEVPHANGEETLHGQAQPSQPKADIDAPVKKFATYDGGETQLSVGDSVQYVQHDKEMFEHPRIISWVSDDQTQAKVRGSNRIIPTVHLIVKSFAPETKNEVKESYVDILSRIITEADNGIPNARRQLKRSQIDAIMTIVARDLLRRGKIDFGDNEDSDDETTSGYETAPNGKPVIALDDIEFNVLLGKVGVTASELAQIQELGRRHGGDIASLTNGMHGHHEVELAKKVMAAAILSLKAPINAPTNTGDKK